MRKKHNRSWDISADRQGSPSPTENSFTHGAGPSEDNRAALWLPPRLLPWPSGVTIVGSIIPTGFAAYARVFHPATTATASSSSGDAAIRWSQVAEWNSRIAHPQMQWEAISRPRDENARARPWKDEPLVGQIPPDTRQALFAVLEHHTSTPNLCWVCLWEGFAGVRDFLSEVPRVEIPYRSYFLLYASLDVIRRGLLFRNPPLNRLTPNLVWPEDRSWCVATEVDLRFTLVGGTASCIKNVLSDELLEAMPTGLEERVDYLSDKENMPSGL